MLRPQCIVCQKLELQWAAMPRLWGHSSEGGQRREHLESSCLSLVLQLHATDAGVRSATLLYKPAM